MKQRETLWTEVFTVATSFAGTLSPQEEEVLTILCQGAVQQWEGRLRPGITPLDCKEAFVVACAWTAFAGLEAARDGGAGEVAFTAGNVSIRPLGDGRQAKTAQLWKQAEQWMRPYVQEDQFAFREVRA